MGVAAVVSLDVSMDSPILTLLKLFNDEGVCVGIGLDVGEEPGRKGFGDVIVVDTGGGVQILDEDSVVGSSGGPHDVALVNVLDVAGLYGEPIDNDGEVGYLPAILFKPLWAFEGVSILACTEALLEVLDGGSATSSDCLQVSTVFGFLRLESFRKSTIPSCLGCRQGSVDAVLNIVSLSSKGGDELFVSVFAIGGAL